MLTKILTRRSIVIMLRLLKHKKSCLFTF